MEKLIDKDALVAEIERRKQDAMNNCGGFKSMREHECDSCIVEQYEEMKNIIDTLEVKEVDLEKYLKEDIEDVFFDLNGVAVKGATHYLTVEDVKDIAKHFFELGLKVAQKGE